VYHIFVKHRVSFCLDKGEFFSQHVECVGHDITPSGNSPAHSKYDLICNWKLPEMGASLHSFLSLCGFYSRYTPWLVDITSLCQLIHKYKDQFIPMPEWSEQWGTLFNTFKTSLTSFPCLAWYDSNKPCF